MRLLFILFRTQIAQIQEIISLTLGIDICETTNIFYEHRLHRLTGYTRLRQELTSVRSRISVVVFRTQITQINRIYSLTLGMSICDFYFTFRSYSRPSAAPKLKRRATLYPVAFR